MGFDSSTSESDASEPSAVGSESSELESALELGGLSLETFCERLAETVPTPGAGSGAAAVAALGASLVSMAFRRSAGEGASPVPVYMGGRADELDVLRGQLLRLVDADAAAYTAFLAARRLDSTGEAARAKRRAVLERAARAALEVPFDILEAALSGLRLAAVGTPDQHPNLVCETVTGALALWSAVESCARIVQENLPIAAIESEAFADHHARALPALIEEGARLLAEVRSAAAPRDSDEPTLHEGSTP